MSDFGQRLAIALAAMVVGFLLKELWTAIRSRRGPLTGKWVQLIYDDGGQIVKTDSVECSHFGEEVKGKVHRREPKDERHKRWGFRGKFRGDLFFGIFWTINEQRNPRSYGTYQLFRVGTQLEGFYVRLKTDGGGRLFTEELKPIRCEWKPTTV